MTTNIEEEQASEPIYDTDCGCCMKPETKKGYEYQSKYNTREVEEYKKGLAKVCELSGIHMCPGCGITPEGLDILIHHQLQKAREEAVDELLTDIDFSYLLKEQERGEFGHVTSELERLAFKYRI